MGWNRNKRMEPKTNVIIGIDPFVRYEHSCKCWSGAKWKGNVMRCVVVRALLLAFYRLVCLIFVLSCKSPLNVCVLACVCVHKCVCRIKWIHVHYPYMVWCGIIIVFCCCCCNSMFFRCAMGDKSRWRKYVYIRRNAMKMKCFCLFIFLIFHLRWKNRK